MEILLKTNDLSIRHALWRRGELDWKLRSAQKVIESKFQEVTKKLFVSNCSRRLGKSYWGAKKSLEVGVKHWDRKIKYASAYLADVEEIIIPAFEFMLKDCPKSCLPRWRETKKKFIFPNRSQIQLIGLDKNPDKVRGQFCDLFIFEEAGYIDELDYLYSSVVIPMFKGRPGAKAVMISTPPRTPAHPFQMFCEKAKIENAYIELDIYQDPDTSPEEIAEYRAECLSETDWKREYLCQFVIDENLAVVPEWKDDYVVDREKDEFFTYYHKYVSMDLGVRDKTVALFAYYDFVRGKVVILDEWSMSGPQMTTDKIADAVKGKEKDHFSVNGNPPRTYLRVADNNNLLLVQDLGTKHDLTFMATKKDDLHAQVNKLRIWVKSGRVEVHPRCQQLLGCLRSAVWKENRKEFDRSVLYGHFDALASIIYLVRNIREGVNPIPANYGVTHDTHFINPGLKLNSNAETLRKMIHRR